MWTGVRKMAPTTDPSRDGSRPALVGSIRAACVPAILEVALGRGVTAARQTLDLLVLVRIQAPQPARNDAGLCVRTWRLCIAPYGT